MINESAKRREKAKQAQKDAVDMAQLYKDLFGSPIGKKVLNNLRAVCGCDADAFNENPNTMAYQVGRLSIGKHIDLMLKDK